MCLFPRKNKNFQSKAYKKGITEFVCGCCPECLSKKSRIWALRASMEAKVSQGMMITLTYDTYKNEKTLEENPVNTNLTVSKSHLQRFFKRLRKHYPDSNIKYIATAEYGKRSHRAHYHCLIFGLQFDDCRFYKKSKRGNIIYKSKVLEKIWQGDSEHHGGICTVDSLNISVATARYCTKYACKDAGIDDTFMLFSHGIGEEMLREKFTGKPYIVDGKSYPIPRTVWQWYIVNKYNIKPPKYVNLPHYDDYLDSYSNFNPYCGSAKNAIDFTYEILKKRYFRARYVREHYAYIRDNDPVYANYIRKEKWKANLNDKYKKTAFQRVLNLDNAKYWSYKQKALQALGEIALNQSPHIPRYKALSYIRDSECERGLYGTWHGKTLIDIALMAKEKREAGHLSETSRHITTNDTNAYKIYTCKRNIGKKVALRPAKNIENCPF